MAANARSTHPLPPGKTNAWECVPVRRPARFPDSVGLQQKTKEISAHTHIQRGKRPSRPFLVAMNHNIRSKTTQLLLILLAGHYSSLLSILNLSIDSISCEAFTVYASRPTTFQRTMSSATEASAEAVTIPNWRVLHKAEKDSASILSLRGIWSESQYNASLELYDRLMECTDDYVAPGIKDALNYLDHAYRLYGPESVICSYNGGKDAVVILHLLRAAHAHYYRGCREEDDSIEPCRPRTVYFDHKDEFPEVMSLLHDTVSTYDLDMVAFEQGVSFSEGLKMLVDNNFPSGSNTAFPMAFVLGTRSSDPNANSQGHFAPSSHYMPPFMRVNPVLDWTYGQVWHFLRLFQLPYCCLYDEGYTSLGTVKDTRPCPALAVAGANTAQGSSVPKYWPAYMLRDWDQERAGRVKKDTKKKSDEKRPPIPTAVSSTVSRPSSVSQYSTMSKAVASEVHEPQAPPPSDTGTTVSDMASSVVSFSSDVTQRSVGLLIIGDEILKGLTVDTNTHAAAKALWEQNVLLTRVVVVSDDQEEIMAEIRRLQNEVDVIITSGGVGPTHDDVTIKSVAAALDRKMVLDTEMAQLLQEKMNTGNGNDSVELSEAQIKMATLPANSTLRYLSDSKSDWPVLQCRNIFILPGVPEFFSKKIEALASYLSSQLKRSATYKLVLSVDEGSIVDALNAAVESHPHVSFGSYPFVSHPEFKTVVTLEGKMWKSGSSRNSFVERRTSNKGQALFSKEQMDFHVKEALDELIRTLPKGSILRVDNNDCMLFL